MKPISAASIDRAAASSASVRLRRLFTSPLNQSKLSDTSEASAARAASLVGSNPFGEAFSGADFTVSTWIPSLSSRPETLGNSNSTPMEPTRELPRATMRSAPSAAM